jgi:hypothetical protein
MIFRDYHIANIDILREIKKMKSIFSKMTKQSSDCTFIRVLERSCQCY